MIVTYGAGLVGFRLVFLFFGSSTVSIRDEKLKKIDEINYPNKNYRIYSVCLIALHMNRARGGIYEEIHSKLNFSLRLNHHPIHVFTKKINESIKSHRPSFLTFWLDKKIPTNDHTHPNNCSLIGRSSNKSLQQPTFSFGPS